MGKFLVEEYWLICFTAASKKLITFLMIVLSLRYSYIVATIVTNN